MTLLFNCQSVSKSYATRILFKELQLSIFSGDRIGLIGPNGSGKSTFLKIIAGLEKADAGTLAPKRDLKIRVCPANLPVPRSAARKSSHSIDPGRSS